MVNITNIIQYLQQIDKGGLHKEVDFYDSQLIKIAQVAGSDPIEGQEKLVFSPDMMGKMMNPLDPRLLSPVFKEYLKQIYVQNEQIRGRLDQLENALKNLAINYQGNMSDVKSKTQNILNNTQLPSF